MTRTQVNEALLNYRAAQGRRGHVEAEIRRIQREIRAVRERLSRNMASAPVSRLVGAPRSTTTAGSPTERLGLALADGRCWASDEARAALQPLEDALARLEREREANRLLAQYVESWLTGLPERERWVIERHIIEGEIWHEVIPQFKTRFGDEVSRDRLKRMQQRALERIYAMAV